MGGCDGLSGKTHSSTEFFQAKFQADPPKAKELLQKLSTAAEKTFSDGSFSKETLRGSFLNHLKITIVYSNAMPGAEQAGCVPENFIRLNPEAMQHLLAEHSANPGPQTENSSLWMRMPSQPGGQEVMNTALRNLFPNGSFSQDGLRNFLASPGFQTLFSGGQFIPGGTLSLPAGELASLVMSFAVSVQGPEAAMAAFITQSILPDLMAGKITEGALRAVLQGLVCNDAAFGAEAHQILNSLGELFSFSGMASMSEVETLLKALADIHSQNLSQDTQGGALEKFQQWTENTALSNHPQAQGLGECVQGNLQGLNQAFSGLLRSVMGMLILNPQNQWPKAMPNEQFLSELGKLFAAQYEKRERKKEKKKAAPKKKHENPEGTLQDSHEDFRGLLGRSSPHPSV